MQSCHKLRLLSRGSCQKLVATQSLGSWRPLDATSTNTMALRRLAQTNNAASASPRNPDSPASPSPLGSSVNGALPSTPRNRVSMGAYRSPASTPSISSSIPFDWNAARSRKPPPYGSPLQSRSQGVGGSIPSTPRKRVVRKKSLVEK